MCIIFVVEQWCQCKLPKDVSNILKTFYPSPQSHYPTSLSSGGVLPSLFTLDTGQERWEWMRVSVYIGPEDAQCDYWSESTWVSVQFPFSCLALFILALVKPIHLHDWHQLVRWPSFLSRSNVQEGHFCNLQPSPRSHCCFPVSVFIVDSWKSFLSCPSLSLLPFN